MHVTDAEARIADTALTTNYADNSGEKYGPGDVVPTEYIKKNGVETFFRSVPLPDEIFKVMQGKSYKANCTVPRSDLRFITCLHKDAEGRTIVGELVVNKSIAADVLEIFRKLYEASYPIERMRLIDYWDADDERSMTDNNSSGFNFRFATNSTTVVSLHGRGLAIDINTRYNPYYKKLANGKELVEPANGKAYVNRTKAFKYKIEKGDLCYRLFKAKGFTWGGEFKSCKDYQHFEINR